MPEGADSKLSASCRQETKGKPVSFITDEAFVTSEENGAKEVEPGLRTLSIPWNVEFDCGVSHEESYELAKIGVPSTEFPRLSAPRNALKAWKRAKSKTNRRRRRNAKKRRAATFRTPPPKGASG